MATERPARRANYHAIGRQAPQSPPQALGAISGPKRADLPTAKPQRPSKPSKPSAESTRERPYVVSARLNRAELDSLLAIGQRISPNVAISPSAILRYLITNS